MMGLLEVAGLVLSGAVLGNQAAHRDALAARRFRFLSPATVGSAADQELNRDWHRVGLEQRLTLTLMATAPIGIVAGNWWMAALAAVLLGATLALVFDVSLNLRLNQSWDYTGTTARTDAWLGAHGAGSLSGGVVAFSAKLLVVVVSAGAWLLIF